MSTGAEGPRVHADSLTALREFVAEHGHALVPYDYRTADGFRLGFWVSNRRAEYRRGKLSAYLDSELATIPGWVWYSFEEKHRAAMAALADFTAQHGHAMVPDRFVSEGGLKLGQWVRDRRAEFRDGALSVDRINELEAVPGWTWKPDRIRTSALGSQHHLDLIRSYAAEHGHARVPSKFIAPEGTRLGAWVSRRRSDRRRTVLDHELAAALEGLPGWDWNPGLGFWRLDRTRAADKLDLLRDFVTEHGHARVPTRCIAKDGTLLGSWASKRRADYQSGVLDPGLVAVLEALPGWDWHRESGYPRTGLWKAEERLTLLREYVAEHGHSRVPANFVAPDGTRLGSWVQKLRGHHRRGELAPGLAGVLEALPGWAWSVRWPAVWPPQSGPREEQGD